MNTPPPVPPAFSAGPKVQWEWIAAGFNLFLQQWQGWVLNILLFLIVLFAPVSLILVGAFVSVPLVTERASPVGIAIIVGLSILLMALMAAVSGFLSAGLFRSAYKQLHGGQVELADLLSGSDVFFQMLAVNAIMMVAALIGLLFCILPAFLVGGLCFFAPALVAIGRLGPVEAIKTSIDTTRHDILPFTLFALVVYLLAGVGGNFCYVGLLATYPLMFTVTAVAYRDCFGPGGRAKAPPATA